MFIQSEPNVVIFYFWGNKLVPDLQHAKTKSRRQTKAFTGLRFKLGSLSVSSGKFYSRPFFLPPKYQQKQSHDNSESYSLVLSSQTNNYYDETWLIHTSSIEKLAVLRCYQKYKNLGYSWRIYFQLKKYQQIKVSRKHNDYRLKGSDLLNTSSQKKKKILLGSIWNSRNS